MPGISQVHHQDLRENVSIPGIFFFMDKTLGQVKVAWPAVPEDNRRSASGPWSGAWESSSGARLLPVNFHFGLRSQRLVFQLGKKF